jgi:hypothetical protein
LTWRRRHSKVLEEGKTRLNKKEDAFREREGMKNYGSIVDAAGCEKFGFLWTWSLNSEEKYYQAASNRQSR